LRTAEAEEQTKIEKTEAALKADEIEKKSNMMLKKKLKPKKKMMM